jgi:predicted nucleotidyltransferase
MDLAQPLSTVAPTLDADALTVLARTDTSLTGRGIASLVRRGSRPGIQAVLDRLVEHGLVNAQPAGSATLYRLNREHLLAEPLLAMVTASATLTNRIRAEIGRWDHPAVAAAIFGWYARGQAHAGSDIDLFLVRPDDTAEDAQGWRAQVDSLEVRVRAWTGNTLEVLEVDEREVAAMGGRKDRLVEDLLSDALHLTGPQPRHLFRPRPSAR